MAYQNPVKPVHFDPKQNATPAPTRTAKDFGASELQYGGSNYGGPSSTCKPGETITSPLADELKRKGDDGTLDKIIKGGSGAVDPPQSPRSHAITSRGSVPTHRDMHANTGSPSGTVPSKNGGK